MHLLGLVERYLKRSGTPATRFGREAVNDPRFVSDLRSGREPRLLTQRKVTAFLAERESRLGAPR